MSALLHLTPLPARSSSSEWQSVIQHSLLPIKCCPPFSSLLHYLKTAKVRISLQARHAVFGDEMSEDREKQRCRKKRSAQRREKKKRGKLERHLWIDQCRLLRGHLRWERQSRREKYFYCVCLVCVWWLKDRHDPWQTISASSAKSILLELSKHTQTLRIAVCNGRENNTSYCPVVIWLEASGSWRVQGDFDGWNS